MSATTQSANFEIGGRDEYEPTSTFSGNLHESVSCYRHAPCNNCGRAGHAHDKERVYPETGPAGSYHYEYVCPE